MDWNIVKPRQLGIDLGYGLSLRSYPRLPQQVVWVPYALGDHSVELTALEVGFREIIMRAEGRPLLLTKLKKPVMLVA